MKGLKTTPCKGCGRPILWGVTADGKRIPLDPRASVYAYESGKAERLGTAYVTHFATCPHANQFSGRNKEKKSEK